MFGSSISFGQYFRSPFRFVFSILILFVQVFGAQRNIHGTEVTCSNINYVRTKQVNNLDLVYSVQSFRGGAKHRVASERAAQRSSRREQLGHTTGVGHQPLQLRVKSLVVLQAFSFGGVCLAHTRPQLEHD